MTLGADRDEDQARRLLRERAQVKEALDRTIARAEVLKELARKIEMAIIVYAGEIADESAESAVAAPSANAKDVAPGSLEAEFASLEINLLERAFAASGAAASETAPTPPTKRSARRRRNAKRTRLQSPRRVTFRGGGETRLTKTRLRSNENESGGAPSAEKPLDALCLWTARASPRSACGLWTPCGCASRAPRTAPRRRARSASRGKRDTAFRAGVEAACAAVETEEGRVEKEKELWRSLGGQEPLRFLSDLARDLGLRPTARGRAGHRGGRAPRGEDARAVRGARARGRRGRRAGRERRLGADARRLRRRRRRRRTASASRWWRCARRGSCARTSGAKCSRCFQMRDGRAKACGRSSGSRSGSRRSGSRTRLVFDRTRSCTYKYKRIFDGRAPSDL